MAGLDVRGAELGFQAGQIVILKRASVALVADTERWGELGWP